MFACVLGMASVFHADPLVDARYNVMKDERCKCFSCSCTDMTCDVNSNTPLTVLFICFDCFPFQATTVTSAKVSVPWDISRGCVSSCTPNVLQNDVMCSGAGSMNARPKTF